MLALEEVEELANKAVALLGHGNHFIDEDRDILMMWTDAEPTLEKLQTIAALFQKGPEQIRVSWANRGDDVDPDPGLLIEVDLR